MSLFFFYPYESYGSALPPPYILLAGLFCPVRGSQGINGGYIIKAVKAFDS